MKYNLSVVNGQLAIKKIIACIIVLFFPMCLFAQTEENPELQKTIQVYSEYKPQISDASRISVNPKVYDTLDIQVNLKYNIKTTPLNTDYHIIPLKAVSVKGDKLPELYKGEIVLGGGNYLTSLFAFRYTTERSRLKQAGIELYHNASAGKVKLSSETFYGASDSDAKYVVPAGYANDYISAYWKRFYENFTLTASIKPQYKSVLRYGCDPLYAHYINSSEKKGVRRSLIGTNVNLGIVSNSTDLDDLRYNLGLDYDFSYLGNPTNVENLVLIDGGVEKTLEKMTLGVTADFRMSALNFEPQDTTMSKIQGVAHAMPYVKVGANTWKLRAGIKASPMFGGINTFKIFPDVALAYSLPQFKIIPYFNLYGDVNLNSMKEMFDANPYVSDSIMIRPTINKLGFDIGVDGRVKKLITYNAAFSVKAFDDMYFWKSQRPEIKVTTITEPKAIDVEDVKTTYAVVYDKATMMKLHGDFGLLFRKVNLGLDANYYYWQVGDSVEKAWYKPIADITISSRFSIVHPRTNKTKLTIEPQLYCMSYKSESDATNTNMTIIDMGVEANYFYNNILLLFVDVNNIFGKDNQRYMDYPSQRCNFLIGASVSFGGHKE